MRIVKRLKGEIVEIKLEISKTLNMYEHLEYKYMKTVLIEIKEKQKVWGHFLKLEKCPQTYFDV